MGTCFPWRGTQLHRVSLDRHNHCRWIHCSLTAIPVGCTPPRVPVPFPLHTSLLSCPRNDTLPGCNTALVLLQMLWVGKREAEITFEGCWSKCKICQGKQWISPHFNALRIVLKWFRNGLGPSVLFLRKGDGLEDPCIHPPMHPSMHPCIHPSIHPL